MAFLWRSRSGPLKPDDTIEAARNIWAGPRMAEKTRLDRIANAVSPRRRYDHTTEPLVNLPGRPTVEMPHDAPDVMKSLAFKSRTNFLPLILDVFSQVMKVDGYIEANGSPSKAWTYWQANGCDARQTGWHRSCLEFGASYVSILPGAFKTPRPDGRESMPVLKGFSPRRMTAIYDDPEIDDWPLMALDVNGPMLRLFDEQGVYRIGIENVPLTGFDVPVSFMPPIADWKFIDFQAHGLGFCPVARFRDRMLLEGEEQFGIVEPLLEIQERVDESVFDLMVAQYYASFKQRYVIGWVPKDDREKLKAEVSSFWTFKDPDVKVGQFAETDLQRYLASEDAAKSDMAAIAQIPASSLNSSTSAMRNVSPEAVASNDAGQDRKGSEIKTSLGETHELILRTAALVDGDETAAGDTSSQVRWRDMSTTSPGAIVDALGKIRQMLGVPSEMLWERLPGWTDQDQKRAMEIVKSGDTLDKLLADLARQNQATNRPNPGGGGVPPPAGASGSEVPQ